MITFILGLVLFTQIYMYTPGQGFGPSQLFSNPEGGLTGRAMWILLGMLLGTIMWFNVWFIIWPAQKSILTGKVPQDKIADVRKKAFIFSRTNTYLSGPMLFAMLAPSHYGAINPITAAVAIGLSTIAIWHMVKVSHKAGATV
jgi:uncharacterized membrane protein